ncbi:MAG: 5'-methylthioadenosine/S-adenosylhomocysteine nucleosidase [Clostridia bacterium]|nr:5'-methylthioadenosine/S-adenosylhomocysteine nucleosidase [Clostridia bacterium]
MKIGFVIADNYEYDPFRKFASEFNPEEFMALTNNCIRFDFDDKIEVVAMKCGIGKVNAAIAALWLINEEKVDTILNVGLSGAVQNVHRNFIVAGTEYMECDFDLTAIGYDLGVKPQDVYVYKADEKLVSIAENCSVDYFGKLGTGDIFLADSALKVKFRDTFGICSFDMETGAIAAVCHKAQIPFLAIRKISDDCDENAVENYRELNDKKEVHLSEVAREILEKISESI